MISASLDARHPGRISVYCGRFAPSPSGPLHFGSLVTALASYLQARSRGGRWLVRMEDLDTPRNQPGAATTILRQLDSLGLRPDGAVLAQSTRLRAYREALAALAARHLTFPCGCSRQDLGEAIYPGTCRNGLAPGRQARAVRVRVSGETIVLQDEIQGEFRQHLSREVGDFVVRRADNIVAYHLAVVVDDAWQGITEVVRGADLLDSTPRQIYLQRLLGLPTPRYAHLPIAADAQGQKLSKQTGARAIAEGGPVRTLHACLEYLGQRPDPRLQRAMPSEVLEWGVAHWDLSKVPRRATIIVQPDQGL
ncbi:MAG: Glutamyl-Q tRNA(Asp) synthetase [Gammaproteobacteria bacterium]|nr:Glutamyl-Q tRNA(Asp) synthetase [Gammaproteobacteria bacterium]